MTGDRPLKMTVVGDGTVSNYSLYFKNYIIHSILYNFAINENPIFKIYFRYSGQDVPARDLHQKNVSNQLRTNSVSFF